MKKILTLLVCLSGTALLAANVDVDGQFKRLKSDGMPMTWIIKSQSNPACGKFKLNETPAGRSIHISATSVQAAAFYTVTSYKVPAKGQKIAVSANVKGAGKVSLDLYVYDASGAWLFSMPVAGAEAKADGGIIAGEIELPAYYPVRRKGEIIDKKCDQYRVALTVAPGCQASFSNIKVEVK